MLYDKAFLRVMINNTICANWYLHKQEHKLLICVNDSKITTKADLMIT